jgi:hypothetical protein
MARDQAAPIVRVPVSSVAAIAGLNPWADIEELSFELLYQDRYTQLLSDCRNLDLELVSREQEQQQLAAKAAAAGCGRGCIGTVWRGFVGTAVRADVRSFCRARVPAAPILPCPRWAANHCGPATQPRRRGGTECRGGRGSRRA